MGEGYCHLFYRPDRRESPEPDPGRLKLFTAAESLSDARRALRRARAIDTRYRAELQALEALAQEVWLRVLREANGETP